MIAVPVVNVDGVQVGEVSLDPACFGGEVNRQLLHDAVLMYEAARRSGTACAKTRAEIAGSKKKVYRQKGTGNARMGDKRTAKRRGGGVVFPPKPRDFSWSMPKKARRLATRMAFLSKFQDGEALVVDTLAFEKPQTKTMAAILRKLGVPEGQSCLVATGEQDKNVYLSGRNLHRCGVLPSYELNAFELIRHKRLLITKAAFEKVCANAHLEGPDVEAADAAAEEPTAEPAPAEAVVAEAPAAATPVSDAPAAEAPATEGN